MIIKDEAVKYLKKAIPLLQDDMRWMNEKYVAAYSSFCDSNGFCNGNAFDVAVAQAKRLKSGNHNYYIIRFNILIDYIDNPFEVWNWANRGASEL